MRNANLARIYQNAGMKEVAVREATRAVENDYTNASAHLFLANSFDALRDPDRILLRYETPWFNELLLANLLVARGRRAAVAVRLAAGILEIAGGGRHRRQLHHRMAQQLRTCAPPPRFSAPMAT